MGILFRCGILFLLCLSAYWAVRLAWADHLSRAGQVRDRERAARLVASAPIYDRLADKLEASGGDALPALQRAVDLDPDNATRRIRLGLAQELAGNFTSAERNLLDAAGLSRLYQPRYILAQYYFRRQNADAFFIWARKALEAAYGDVSPILELCWIMRSDPNWLQRSVLPDRPEIARQYLLCLGRWHQMGAAGAFAAKMADKATAGDLPFLVDFCERSLGEGEAGPAMNVWNQLCRTGLLPNAPLDPQRGISLTDGGFQGPQRGLGFDWRLPPSPGIACRRGSGELRVTFSGRQAERCGIAWQFIPVQRGLRYRLRSEFQNSDSSLPEGLVWRVFAPGGAPIDLRAASDGSLGFLAPAELLKLALEYQRPAGSTRLEGTVAVRNVRLEIEP